MSTPLRVLLIEDSDDDAALLLRALRNGGYDPSWRRVDSASGLAAALAEGEWDLITCDWVMPAFGALAALDLLREQGCDLPVIIVSGEVGEEVAVSALKNGAQDYISKHKLTRLLPAVERELREHADLKGRQHAEASLRRAQDRLQLFVERASDIIVTLDREGTLTSVNPAVADVLGYRPEELVGRAVSDLVAPAGRAGVRAALERIWSDERVEIVEVEMLAKSGARRILEVSGRAIHGQGMPGESFHIARDVTEQRRAESERARLSAALEQAPEPITITDDCCKIVYMNAAGERLSGVSRRALEGRVYTVIPAEQGVPVPLDRLLADDGTWSGLVVQPTTRSELRMEIVVSPIRDDGGRISHYVSRVRRIVERAAAPSLS